MILAGGASRRYGEDKAFADWDGKTFLARVADAMRPVCHNLVVLGRAGGELKRYQASVPDAPVRLDVESMAGPVAALRRAVADSRAQWIVVAPCDAPALTTDGVRELLTAARKARDVAVAKIPTGPLFDLFCSPAPILQNRLAKARRLEDLTEGGVVVEFADALGMNVNEPAAAKDPDDQA